MSQETEPRFENVIDRSAPAVRPEVALLDELFEEATLGRLRIPNFQRPFVWKPSDMRALFESIASGYPIGSVLVWDTSDEYESRTTIGPIEIPAPAAKPVSYLLDGQQRVSTLYGALRLPRDFPRDENQEHWQWWIWYDLRKGTFVHHQTPRYIPPHLLPIRALLRTADFLQFSRELNAKLPNEAATLIDEAERLVQRVKSYKIAVTRIRGGSLDQAVEIFSRLNTRGQPMKADEMVSALTYREGRDNFHLAHRIDEILTQLTPYRFAGIERVFVFRTIIAIAGERMLRTDWTLLVKKLRGELPEHVKRAERALVEAARFLQEGDGGPGVPSEAFLPYGYQLVFLGQFFAYCDAPGEAERDALWKWFWSTSFSGWFAGANPGQMGEALEAMKAFACDRNPQHLNIFMSDSVRPYPKRFTLRSARVRALLLTMLARLRPRLLDGRLLNARQMLWSISPSLLPYVFRSGVGDMISNPANRMLLDFGISTRTLLLQLQDDVRGDVLASHGISEEAYEALRDNQGQRFIELRARRLAEEERAWMQELGLGLPHQEFGEADVDTDGPE